MNDLESWIREPIRLPLLVLGAGMEWMRRVTAAPFEALSRFVPAQVDPLRKETQEMKDQDLGGDDVKLVRYKILFVKREYEAVLDEGEALVTYPTRGGEMSGLKIGELVEKAARNEVRPPKSWPSEYPDTTATGWTIPEQDRRYIRFYFEVLDRFPREKAEYDREQVKVLHDISRKIG